MLVSFTISGWGGDAYFQAVTMQTAELIPAGAWLHIELQHQCLALPVVESGRVQKPIIGRMP